MGTNWQEMDWWWLILWVNLIGLLDAQRAGKTFLGVSVRLLLEKISIGMVDKRPPPQQVCKIQSIESLNQKGEEGRICSLLELKHPSFHVLGQVLSSRALRLGLNYTTGCLGSPAYRQQAKGLLIWANSYNKSSNIYIWKYIYIYTFLWKTLADPMHVENHQWLKY